jgi:D-alanyl-D-alanine carboxypeptidase (penicillin-binding protein 5/6)
MYPSNARLLTPLLLLATLLVLSITDRAQASVIPAPPEVDAKGYLLIDFASGTVLAESNADIPLEPASITKIMTAYVVFREIAEGNIALEDEVLVSHKAWKTPGSRMFIEVNDKVSVEQLLHGLITQSGNDAGVALAEYIAGTEETFAQLMNSHAKRLGMTATHFVNSTGLPHEDHYTTAHDIAKVTEATIREFPEFYTWYSLKEYTYADITQPNRNKLLWRDKSVDGVKTGHTQAAGYCLVASAERDDMRLISVVLGTESVAARNRESLSLLNYGFRFYESYRLYLGGKPLKDQRVWKGASQTVPIGIREDLSVAIPRGQFNSIKASMELPPRLNAPISEGQPLGTLRVELEGVGQIASTPLIALRGVEEGSLWQQAKDSILIYLE